MTNKLPESISVCLILISEFFYPSVVLAVNPEIVELPNEDTGKIPGFYTDSFHILPEVQATAYYDDNIFARVSSEESDTITVLSPSVKIKSLWDSHSLNLDTGGNFGRYQDNNAEDYDDAWIKLDGKYDTGKESNLFGSAGYSRKHEGRDSKESAQTLEEITTYDVTELEAGIRHSREDLTFRLGLTNETLDFDNVGTLFNDDRDRSVTGLGLRASKLISEGNRVYLQSLINQRDYDQSLDSSGYNRDSDGYSAVIGASRSFTGGGKFEAFAGILSQEYDDARFESVDEPDYGATLHWYPGQTVKVVGSLKRSLRETTEPGASGYLNTVLSLQLDKKIITNVIGYLSLSHGIADYQQIDREDEYDSVGLGLKYFMSPHVFFTTSVNHFTNDSNDRSIALPPGDSYDFDKNLFLLSMKVRLAP